MSIIIHGYVCISCLKFQTKLINIMKKEFWIILIVLFTSFASAMAQVKVNGTISDPDGSPMPGVSIVEKGTTNGTSSNSDGKYTLSTISSGAVLQFSFVGMKAFEEVVNGKTVIDVKMESASVGLEDVIVTALGIKRDKKTLTYAAQQVSGDEMLKTKDINFMNALSGKTAGLEIQKSSSGPGGSTKVLLRGNKSISGDSEPLYVIDGIPMSTQKGGQPGYWGGSDRGDALSLINPEDIESISILKGSNAAILYGSQGANGVVVISTKKGKAGKTDISFSSSTIFESVIETPELQFDYGSTGGAKESWSYTRGDYAKNYVKDFFRTGTNHINSLSIKGGNDKTTVYFSYSNTSSTGVVPNNDYQKHNLTLKQSTKFFNDKMKISSNVMFSTEKVNNRNAAGYGLNPLTGLYMFPRDKDFSSFKENYQVFNADRNMYLQNWHVNDHLQSNPYWIINKEPKIDLSKRIIASITLEYDIAKNLKFQARGNYDFALHSYEEKHAAGSNPVYVGNNGKWLYNKYDVNQIYTDAILTYKGKVGNFSLDATLGATYSESSSSGVNVDSGLNDLLYPNEFSFQNLPLNVRAQSTGGATTIKEGAFGNFQIGFKEMLFLDFSGRNDWASTLYGTGNDSYFYPAIGITGIISQMISLPEYITFAKVRASSTTVANEVPFGVVNPTNSINSSGGINRNTTKPFTNLKPEMIQSTEIGTEWRFFKGRLGLDFTYYNINSKDQFIQLGAPSGSGWTSYYVNAGEIVNKGVEITLDAEPLRANRFSWKTSFNFSMNKNTIVSLIPEFPDYKISLGGAGYSAYVLSGGSFGDVYGYKFQRNTNGQIMLDEKSGKPLRTSAEEYLGNLNSDWSLGWNNTINFKNFSLGILINSKVGGKVVSMTESLLDGAGVSQRSADARDIGYVTVNAIKGTTQVTQVDPKLWYTNVGDRDGILEQYTYDRTNIRLSQLSLSYDIDMNKLKMPVKNASFSLVGQNLLYLYKKAPFDPEISMSTGNSYQSLDIFNVPATRTYGFNLKLTF